MSEQDQQLEPVAQEPPQEPHEVCANCGARLHGPWCYACGQPVKNLIRHLLALAGDAMDLIFNVDGRIVHTLPALYLKPGFLTNEYLAGRRARYIPPFRLMFFLSVLAFLLIQLSLNLGETKLTFNDSGNPFAGATSTAQVHGELRRQLDALDQARAALPDLPGMDKASAKIQAKEATLRKQAHKRMAQLGESDAPAPGSSAAAAAAALLPSGQMEAWRQMLASADSLGELQKELNATVGQIDTRLAEASLSPARRKQLQAARDGLYTAAGKRMRALSGAVPASDAISGKHRFHIGWLPASINARLDAATERLVQNARLLTVDAAARQRFAAGIFNVLPQTMFVLMPFFALLLKVVYLFKRRLYMEHVIVAFHSHAFIFMSLLLLAVLHLLKSWLVPLAGWVAVPLNLLTAAAWIWLPVYLLIMQKRVYRQGWIMTWLKYWLVGICYMILLSFAVSAGVIISLMD